MIYESTAIFALESKIAATKLPEKPPKASGWSRFLNFFGYKTEEMKKYDTDMAAYEKACDDKAMWEAELQNRQQRLPDIRETVNKRNKNASRKSRMISEFRARWTRKEQGS